MKLHFVLMAILICSSCYNDSEPKTIQDIVLYDKSVPVIKSSLSGKWKLSYKIGGLTGNERTDYGDTYFEFKFQTTDTFTRTDSGKVTINSPITWLKSAGFANDSIYVIEYKLPNGVELGFYPKSIQKSILTLVEPCSDCYCYFLSYASKN